MVLLSGVPETAVSAAPWKLGRIVNSSAHSTSVEETCASLISACVKTSGLLAVDRIRVNLWGEKEAW